MKVPFFSFSSTNSMIRKEILQSFEDFFDNSSYILGDNVRLFEQKYAQFNEVKYCIGSSNGLDALVNCLHTLNIGTGDEVIVPSNSFFATALSVQIAGAKVVFAEPDPFTFNIHPENIKTAITPSTKAIIPVHLYGQACRMDEIMTIAKQHGIHVIEDNAQAQGATFNEKKTGSFGSINATSFYPTKNLGALGDAGAITTDDEQLSIKARAYRNYGSSKKYYHEVIGENNRLDECQAGFLTVKLNYLEKWNQERISNAALYTGLLTGIEGLITPALAKGSTSVYHLYVIQTEQREKLMQHLSDKDIGTLIHYPVPAHLQKAFTFMKYKEGAFPIAEKQSASVLSLPLFPGIKKEQIEYVCEQIKLFFA